MTIGDIKHIDLTKISHAELYSLSQYLLDKRTAGHIMTASCYYSREELSTFILMLFSGKKLVRIKRGAVVPQDATFFFYLDDGQGAIFIQ